MTNQPMLESTITGDVLFAVYEVLVVCAPALLLYAILRRFRTIHSPAQKPQKAHGAQGWWQRAEQERTLEQAPTQMPRKKQEGLVGIMLLGLYIACVLSVTGFGTVYDLFIYGFEYKPEQVNLIPLLMDSYPLQYQLNVVLFIPLGLLIPLIWPGAAKVGYALIYGLGFSLLIELSQLLNNRASDIDDLIMNTLGALIGFALFALLRKFGACKRRERADAKSALTPVSEVQPVSARAQPALYLGVMLLGWFFLFNDMGLAKLIYGF